MPPPWRFFLRFQKHLLLAHAAHFSKVWRRSVARATKNDVISSMLLRHFFNKNALFSTIFRWEKRHQNQQNVKLYYILQL